LQIHPTTLDDMPWSGAVENWRYQVIGVFVGLGSTVLWHTVTSQIGSSLMKSRPSRARRCPLQARVGGSGVEESTEAMS
jgi:hypothetical protein